MEHEAVLALYRPQPDQEPTLRALVARCRQSFRTSWTLAPSLKQASIGDALAAAL